MLQRTNPDVAVLQGVIKVLKKQGWTRGKIHDNVGYCLLGAFNMATKGYCIVKAGAETPEAMHFANLLGFSSGYCMINWNDHCSRTKTEVLERLDWALQRALVEAS